jgi:hypothetical protein
MVEKVYFALWGILLITAGIFYLTGAMDVLTAVVFGFIFFGLTFMGLIGVLPHYVTHHDELKH